MNTIAEAPPNKQGFFVVVKDLGPVPITLLRHTLATWFSTAQYWGCSL